MIIQVVLDWQNNMPLVAETGESFQKFGGSPLGRALNVFAFFTIQSNLIVGATSLLLAINPNRSSTVFSVFRLTGLVAITVTGIVTYVALDGLLVFDTWALTADKLLHVAVPIMAVVGWLAFGPRGLTSPRVVKLAVLFPSHTCFSPRSVARSPRTGTRTRLRTCTSSATCECSSTVS
ncbi:hypothetical protein BTZ20_4724 [Rhodococcus sp. MTM3W5.2]|nr:Pr6Pr family membrane protein [Rhodococcus sp. MTM3W5.2]AQA25715.1 hypothetical protein BTZ20_4724 [Rhodococcus sp. MTM3W5.2]